MSTIRITKDGSRGKKGEIISVPFGVGKEMVAAGTGEYPAQPEPKALPVNIAVPSIAAQHAADIQRLNEAHAATVAELKADAADALKRAEDEHEKTMKAKQAELDTANAKITELQKKSK